MEKTLKLQRQQTEAQIQKNDDDTYLISFSSEEYIRQTDDMWLRLSHEQGAADLTRLNTVGPLLADHDKTKQVGVIEKAYVEGNRGYAYVRFSENELGQQFKRDVDNKIKTGVSPTFDGLARMDYEREGQEFWTAHSWTPSEISIVSMPADISVGFGRDAEIDDESPANALVQEEMVEETENEKSQPIQENREMSDQPAKPVELNAEEKRDAQFTKVSREVYAVGKQFDKVTQAAEYIATAAESNKDISVEEFQRSLLQASNTPIEEKVTASGSESAELGLSDKDAKRFSLVRMFRALVMPQDRKAQKDAAFELEVSNAHRDKFGYHPDSNGSIPQDILERNIHGQRTVQTGTSGSPGAGFDLVATDHLASSFIENLRNMSVLMSKPIRRMTGLVGNVDIPSRDGSGTAYWVGESGAVTESNPTYGKRQLTPKTLGVLSLISRSQLLQTSIDVEADVRRDMARTRALEIDRAGIYGSGTSNQPLGFANAVGINAVTFAGVNPTWPEVVQMETEVDTDNALEGELGYLMNPVQKGYFKSTEKFTGSNGKTFIDDGSKELNGYGYGSSNQIVSGDMFFLNFADIMMGLWGGIDVLVDPYSQADTGDVRIVTFQSVDFAFRHLASFCVGRD